MKEIPLELSHQVVSGRYANFLRSQQDTNGVFLIGYEQCSGNYRIERSQFPYWTMEIIVNGEGGAGTDADPQKLSPGSLFIYGPGVAQRFWNSRTRPFHKYFLAHTGNAYPEGWTKAGLAPDTIYQLGSTTSVVKVLDQMIDEEKEQDVLTGEVLSSLENVLLTYIVRNQGVDSTDKSAARQAYEITMKLISEEYQHIHSLKALAQKSGYSAEYLCRVFKKHHIDSPYQVLLHRKMSVAWLLLRDGQLQVAAVATEVGFKDPLHFSRLFKKVMGFPPSHVSAR